MFVFFYFLDVWADPNVSNEYFLSSRRDLKNSSLLGSKSVFRSVQISYFSQISYFYWAFIVDAQHTKYIRSIFC